MKFEPMTICGPQVGTLLQGKRISRLERQTACYADNGSAIPFSDIRSAELTTYAQTEPEFTSDTPVYSGPVLFAGLVLEQFGHVLMNSLGRLWALEELPPNAMLLFVPKRRQSPAVYLHLRPVLDMLGVFNQAIISRGPMRFPELYTAADIFGERYEGLGLPEFFEWLDPRLPETGPVVSGRSVYVTRANLGSQVGRYACEDHLERLLTDAGYAVFSPEEHILAEQIRVMRTAERLVFSEGSALHLFAMIRRPEQCAAVIQRREALPNLITMQFQARPGPPIRCIQAIKNIFWLPKRSDHLSVSVLDFDHIKDELIEGNFIGPHSRWISPTLEQEMASLNAGLTEGDKMLNRIERDQFLFELRRK